MNTAKRIVAGLACCAFALLPACDTRETGPATDDNTSVDAQSAALQSNQGPWRIGRGTYRVVINHVESKGDTTATHYHVVDDNNRVVYERSFANTDEQDANVTYQVSAAPLGSLGIGIREQTWPSAPLTGERLRILVPRSMRLVELVPPIDLYGEIGEFRDGAQMFVLWRSEYGIEVPVQVQFGCMTADAACLVPQSQRTVGPGLGVFTVRAEPRPIEQEASVALYRLPDRTAVATTVTVGPGSTVEVAEAAARITINAVNGYLKLDADEDWLHVRIDGRDGWIQGHADANAIGLPTAG